MKIILRICGGVLGLAAAVGAVLLPLFFFANEYNEAQSAKQYGGRVSIPGAVGGILTVLVLTGFLALISYFFTRYALRGEKPKTPH